jgi:hypothetical protein
LLPGADPYSGKTVALPADQAFSRAWPASLPFRIGND